jgi:hypothetical protein
MRLIILTGGSGCGKAQPLSEPVLTPSGWSPIGELSVGDKIISSYGNTSTITGIFPQGNREVYKVHFVDGTYVRCDLEHLWKVYNQRHKTKNKLDGGDRHQILTTAEIKASIRRANNGYRYTLPVFAGMQNGLNVPEAYAIGYILGNGCVTGNILQITPHIDDCEEIKKILNLEGLCHMRKPLESNTSQLTYKWLSQSPLIQKMRGQEKLPPKDWELWDRQSRLSLLRGLMDSDGTASSHSNSFSSKSLDLVQLVKNLTLSLGGFSTYSFCQRENRDGLEYRVGVRLNDVCFSLKRKADICHSLSTKRREGLGATICDVTYDGEEECVCISVDSPDSLYVTAGYKLTHNTTMMSYAKTFDGVDAVDTGDLFKALYALVSLDKTLIPLEILTGDDALENFVLQNLNYGITKYERLKGSGISGKRIIYFIETLRALCPDLPARWVRKYAEIMEPKTLVTTAINESELGYLVNQFCVDTQIDTVALRCENPVVRQGDNRVPVPEHLCDKTFRYSLAQSLEIMNEILFNFD